jgi:capsular polysaccharide biosynthesis protein
MKTIKTDFSEPETRRNKDSYTIFTKIPTCGEDSVIEPNQCNQRVRHIGSDLTLSSEILARLHRFYSAYLKHFGMARAICQWLGRRRYHFYVLHIYIHLTIYIQRTKGKAKRWRSLTGLSDFAQRRKIPKYELADSVVVETPAPTIFPARDQENLVSHPEQYIYPKIYVAEIINAMTYGGTNLILADGEVICHDLYDFNRDYTSEELYGRILIDQKSSRIRWLLHDEEPEPIPVAASFVDACALNYAHWLTEVLPRIALFCAEERFRGVPIVINAGLHKNIMESLFLLIDAKREIIALPIGKALTVDKLYTTSVTGYVPYGRRTSKLSGHSQGIFSPNALEKLRNHLINLEQKTENEVWPEKIYLQRNSETRKLLNSTEIETLCIARGYAVVETEKLTFRQQVRLFNNAKEIIAPTGAALSNAMFCKPGTKVAILMAKHADMIYRYWFNMLAPLQINVSYVFGNIIQNRFLGIHSDFVVNSIDVIDLLDYFEKI